MTHAAAGVDFEGRSSPDLLLDVTRLLVQFGTGKAVTGIDRVCLAYVRRFRAESRAVIQVRRGFFSFSHILSRRDSEVLYQRLLAPGQKFGQWLILFLARVVLKSAGPRPDVRGAIYLNVGHMGIGVPGYGDWLVSLGVKPVFLVHDLIPITHPEYCTPRAKELHQARMETVLNHAAGVITNSQASLTALQDFADERGAILPYCTYALLGDDLLQNGALRSAQRPLAEPYFVVVGTIEARKNHLLLLQVWRKLVQIEGDRAPRLVVIGRRGWEAESVIDLLERCESLQGVVIEHSSCCDAELVGYLKHAKALLFPSHTEGYGLPLIEALGLGTPVLASDLSVFREIAQDIPDYIDPLDGMAWLAAVQDYAQDGSERRGQQLNRMLAYRQPQWSEHFAKVDAWLGQLR